jgi:hypothetical protein
MKCPQLARILVQNSSGEIHTSCQTRSISAISLLPNQTTISSILNLHNNARRIVIPTASSMASLAWDFRLARIAQSRANQCIMAHDCPNCRILVNNQTIFIGQNAFAQIYGEFDWISAISAWINQRRFFIYGNGSSTGNWENIGELIIKI